MMNPMQMLMQAISSGGNPMQMIQQRAANDPRMRQFNAIVGGKSPQELQKIADNMLRQRGSSYEQASQQLAQRMGLPPR